MLYLYVTNIEHNESFKKLLNILFFKRDQVKNDSLKTLCFQSIWTLSKAFDISTKGMSEAHRRQVTKNAQTFFFLYFP